MSLFVAIFVLSSAFTGVISAPAVFSTSPGQSKAFHEACERWEVFQDGGNAWFEAYCRSEDGSRWHSVINMNRCIANDHGTLSARAQGDFAWSCHDLHLNADTSLDAVCGDGQSWVEANVKLDDVLSNDDGTLRCFDAYGCAVDGSACVDKPPRK